MRLTARALVLAVVFLCSGCDAGREEAVLELSVGSLEPAVFEVGASFDETVEIRNAGRADLRWSAETGSEWVEVSPSRGTLGPGASAVLTVAGVAPLLDDVHELLGRVSIGSNVGTTDLDVVLRYYLSVPVIETTGLPIILSLTESGQEFSSSFVISNTGERAFDWSIPDLPRWVDDLSVASAGRLHGGAELEFDLAGTVPADPWENEPLIIKTDHEDVTVDVDFSVSHMVVPTAATIEETESTLYVGIQNLGSRAEGYVVLSDPFWLGAIRSTGQVEPPTTAGPSFEVFRCGLTAGVHEGEVTIQTGFDLHTVTVSVHVPFPADDLVTLLVEHIEQSSQWGGHWLRFDSNPAGGLDNWFIKFSSGELVFDAAGTGEFDTGGYDDNMESTFELKPEYALCPFYGDLTATIRMRHELDPGDQLRLEATNGTGEWTSAPSAQWEGGDYGWQTVSVSLVDLGIITSQTLRLRLVLESDAAGSTGRGAQISDITVAGTADHWVEDCVCNRLP